MDFEDDPDLQKFMEMVREDTTEERYKSIAKTVPPVFKTKNEFFETAGIDKNIVSEIEQAAVGGNPLHDICNLLAPVLRKALSVDIDSENAVGDEIKFKRIEEQNVLDEIGMSDDTTAQMMELIAKCYSEDKDEDWHQLSHLLLPYADKFFAPAYRNAKELGLTLEDEK